MSKLTVAYDWPNSKWRVWFCLFIVVACGTTHPRTALAAAPPKWTLAVIGDQQWAVTEKKGGDYLDRFSSQVDWLADHAKRINLRMVVQVGDIVEYDDEPSEWKRASSVMEKFDRATNADGGKGIPWSVAYGNHEIVGLVRPPTANPAGPDGSAIYRHFFGSASGKHRYANQREFKGVSSNDLNTWHIIKSSAAGDARSFLMLNLEIDVPGQKPDTVFDAIRWAQKIIDENRGLPTIITTHVFEGSQYGPPKKPYLAGFGHNSQLEIYDKLIKVNPQIFMVLSGHTSEETHRVRKNRDGQPVLQMTTDYNKWLGTAGDGYFRLIEIDEAASKLRVRTYSAKLDQYRTNADGQFELDLSFKGRFTAAPN